MEAAGSNLIKVNTIKKNIAQAVFFFINEKSTGLHYAIFMY
jgi:hypothetical protein